MALEYRKRPTELRFYARTAGDEPYRPRTAMFGVMRVWLIREVWLKVDKYVYLFVEQQIIETRIGF